MRLPRITQLTKAQKDVYLYAPTDKHVLVHGPPGTGKTLIACLRAREIEKRGSPVVLGMFNSVLSKYSSSTSDGNELPAQTVHRWFLEWWRASGLPPYLGPESRVIIDFKYTVEDKDAIKSLGARWDKSVWRAGANRPGAWTMTPEQYEGKRDAFPSHWRAFSEPPKHEGTPWIDWAAVQQHIVEHADTLGDWSLSLGSVLIDEGQDFAPFFYGTLRWLSAAGQSRQVKHPLRCCILADENQQITEENSTLEQIAKELKIPAEYQYKLVDNFRNSREIAECAAAFFSDVGFKPTLPKRSGETPVFVTAPDHSHVIQRIKAWLVNNPGKEAGVLTFSETTRRILCEKLEPALRSIRGRGVVLQTYSSKTWSENPARDLVFDTGDVVTVLNLQSCKGLEFDAVFLIDPHQAKANQQTADRFKMQMFVAISRARESVTLMDTGPHAGTGDYAKFLPPSNLLEREVVSGRAQEDGGSGGKNSTLRARKGSPTSGNSREVPVDWETRLNELVKKRGLKFNDRRTSGGALWVNGGPELGDSLKPLGFQYATMKAAWWRK